MVFKLYYRITYYNTKVYIILLYIFIYRYSDDTIIHYSSNFINFIYKKKDLWYYARADIPWCAHSVTLQITSTPIVISLSNKKIIRQKLCYKFLRLYNVYNRHILLLQGN